MFEPQKCQNMAFDLPYNIDLPPILIIAKKCTQILQWFSRFQIIETWK